VQQRRCAIAKDSIEDKGVQHQNRAAVAPSSSGVVPQRNRVAEELRSGKADHQTVSRRNSAMQQRISETGKSSSNATVQKRGPTLTESYSRETVQQHSGAAEEPCSIGYAQKLNYTAVNPVAQESCRKKVVQQGY
jgi:hypothetical protein